MSALKAQLDTFVETAMLRAEARATTSFGPIPLELRGDSQSDIDGIAEHLAPARRMWSPTRVVTVSSASIGADELPPELNPHECEQSVARLTDMIAISSNDERSLWVLDNRRNAAVRWVDEHGDLPLWEHISPLRAAARWCAAENDAATVHAGAVSNSQGAVLLVGDAGAGKSTTTMSCHGSDLDVLGDDFCFLQPPTATDPAMVHAMYRLGKLDDNSLSLLPHLRDRITGQGLRGKSLITLDPPRSPTSPVRGICHIVQDSSQPTRLSPVSRAAALRAVAPSTIFQVRLFEQETWSVLSRTVRSVPCYQLCVNQLADVAPLLQALLSELVAPA